MIDFSKVTAVTIPEGAVTSIEAGGSVLWNRKYKTALSYIESTGDQYIVTDYYPSNKSRIIVSLKFNTTNVQQRVFSAITSPYYCDIYINGSGNIAFNAGTSRKNTSANVKADTNWHQYEIDTHTVKLDGKALKTLSASVGQCSYPMVLFARRVDAGISYSDYPTTARIEFIEVYEDGTLLHNFIPVLDWSDTPCLYDKVSGEFFYNKGTGNFLYQ